MKETEGRKNFISWAKSNPYSCHVVMSHLFNPEVIHNIYNLSGAETQSYIFRDDYGNIVFKRLGPRVWDVDFNISEVLNDYINKFAFYNVEGIYINLDKYYCLNN